MATRKSVSNSAYTSARDRAGEALGAEVFAQGVNAVGSRVYAMYNVGGYDTPSPQLSVLFRVGKRMTGEQHAVHYLGLYDTFPRPAEETKTSIQPPYPSDAAVGYGFGIGCLVRTIRAGVSRIANKEEHPPFFR